MQRDRITHSLNAAKTHYGGFQLHEDRFTKTEGRPPFSAALAVALLVGAGVTEGTAATLSDAVGSAPSEATLVQPVDYRGDGFGSMQEWNASMARRLPGEFALRLL